MIRNRVTRSNGASVNRRWRASTPRFTRAVVVVGAAVALIVSSTVFSAVVDAPSAVAAGGVGHEVAGLIVAYESGVAPTEAPGVATGSSAVVAGGLEPGSAIGFELHTVKLAEPMSVERARKIAAKLASSPQVKWAEPDYAMSFAETGDVHAVQTSPPWGLDRIDQRALPLTNTYDYGTAGAGVTVAGVAGVPADADAVVLNVTVTETSGASNLVVWPKGQAKPVASSLNWVPGWTVPNAVTVKVGAFGQISLYNNSGDADVVVDVVGYFNVGTGSAFHPLAPMRVQDSRPSSNVGPYTTPWGSGATRDVTVASAAVPASAIGVLLNMTVTNTTGSSNLVVWPKAEVKPVASSLNWVPGWTIPNAVTAKVGGAGKITVYNNVGSADVIVDVAGWYG